MLCLCSLQFVPLSANTYFLKIKSNKALILFISFKYIVSYITKKRRKWYFYLLTTYHFMDICYTNLLSIKIKPMGEVATCMVEIDPEMPLYSIGVVEDILGIPQRILRTYE